MNIRKISALAAISVFAAATAYAKEITVSGSSATQCSFKVGNGGALQIQGVSCK